jgi:putative transposase
MARPLRIEFEDAFYHITSRGNEQKDIFKSVRDREKFLQYLESATERYSAAIHAYCLMDNHYHLFLQTPAGNVSQIMQHINGAYTTYYNVKRKRAGHLFQGRYKALLVDADAHAQELSRYIHLNPVRAGVTEKPEQYPWSSYNAYINRTQQPEWLHTDFILGLFAARKEPARKQYRRFVESLVGKEQESPLRNIFASTILGDAAFISRIREQYVNLNVYDRNLPDIKHFYEKPDIEEIVRLVEKAIPEDSGLSKRVQLYICHKYSGQKLKDIGLYFGVGESGVSQSSRRVAMKIGEDKKMKKLIRLILSDLNLSRV